MKDLKRDIYENLLDWKENHSGKVLEVEGARQVGKTYIISKFARENYKNCIWINMVQTTGRDFLRCLDAAEQWTPGEERIEKPIHKALELFDKNFVDTEETIIFIDEIQESSRVFSLIRQFAREFQAHFIVTGSYLGKVVEKEYFLPAGDLDRMVLDTLSFEEFLDAVGKREIYNRLDLYGKSTPEEYEEIKKIYKIYCQIGGYPAVVKKYLETSSIQEAQNEIGGIIHIFVQESERYFDDILQMNLLEQLLPAIAQLMLKEKKGSSNLVEELSRIVFHEDTNRITKASVNHAIAWFYRSHIIGYCGKVNEGNILEMIPNCRFYFCDIGVALYFLNITGAVPSDIDGIVSENFVYLYLKKQVEAMVIAGNTPMFASYKNGELDFFVNSRMNFVHYGIEVKAGKNQGKTAMQMLQDGKVSYIYYLKGDTYGGCAGRIITIPIYLMGRVVFDREAAEFFMLDSTAYNHITESSESFSVIEKSVELRFRYFSTSSQDVELGIKEDDNIVTRKLELSQEQIEKFTTLDKRSHIERLSEAAIGNSIKVDGSTRFFAPDSLEGQLCQQILRKNEESQTMPPNYIINALVAEAAMHHGCILVTDDKELRDIVNLTFKNKAISTEELIRNIKNSISKQKGISDK